MTTIKSRYYWERIWKKEMSKCKQVMIWLISSYLLLMNNRLSIKFFTLCFIKNYHMIIRLGNVFQLRYTLLYIVSGKKYFLNWQPFNPFLLEIWQKLNYDYIFFFLMNIDLKTTLNLRVHNCGVNKTCQHILFIK